MAKSFVLKERIPTMRGIQTTVQKPVEAIVQVCAPSGSFLVTARLKATPFLTLRQAPGASACRDTLRRGAPTRVMTKMFTAAIGIAQEVGPSPAMAQRASAEAALIIQIALGYCSAWDHPTRHLSNMTNISFCKQTEVTASCVMPAHATAQLVPTAW